MKCWIWRLFGSGEDGRSCKIGGGDCGVVGEVWVVVLETVVLWVSGDPGGKIGE